MLNTWLKIQAWLRDNPGIFVAMILIGAILFWTFGCEPTTQSLINPQEKINEAQLNSEIENLVRQTEIRFADLERQQELRQLIFNHAIVFAESGSVNPVGVITALMALFGVGATVDDVRLRQERKRILTYEQPPAPNA